jgi:hypothetical protein
VGKLWRALLFGLGVIFLLIALGLFVVYHVSGDWLFGHYRGASGWRIAAQIMGCLGLAALIAGTVAGFFGRPPEPPS